MSSIFDSIPLMSWDDLPEYLKERTGKNYGTGDNPWAIQDMQQRWDRYTPLGEPVRLQNWWEIDPNSGEADSTLRMLRGIYGSNATTDFLSVLQKRYQSSHAIFRSIWGSTSQGWGAMVALNDHARLNWNQLRICLALVPQLTAYQAIKFADKVRNMGDQVRPVDIYYWYHFPGPIYPA